jgi:hypothetical protein
MCKVNTYVFQECYKNTDTFFCIIFVFRNYLQLISQKYNIDGTEICHEVYVWLSWLRKLYIKNYVKSNHHILFENMIKIVFMFTCKERSYCVLYPCQVSWRAQNLIMKNERKTEYLLRRGATLRLYIIHISF